MEWGSRDLFTESWAETVVLHLHFLQTLIIIHDPSVQSKNKKLNLLSIVNKVFYGAFNENEKPTVLVSVHILQKTADHIVSVRCITSQGQTNGNSAIWCICLSTVGYLHHLDALTLFPKYSQMWL